MQGPDIGSDSTAATRRREADTAEGLRARAGAGSQRPSHDGHFEPDGLGDTLAAISRRVVGLYKEHYGRGPVRARTYWWSDLVVVLLRDGFTPLEKTLQQAGRGDVVERVRLEFQHAMREDFKRIVEEEMRREVVAFMSSSHYQPDINAEIFVLAPDTNGEAGGPSARAASARPTAPPSG